MNRPFSCSDGEIHLFDAFGVELEYMIVDRKTFRILPIADRILRNESGEIVQELERNDLAWSNELVLHAFEIKTNGPARQLEGLDQRFHGDVLHINAQLESEGGCLMPSAAHPFMDPYSETNLWPHDNSEIYRAFDRIFDCRGHGWSNLQSVHLNLPFCGNEEFVRLHSAIRIVLPLIPALAAASPYLDGKDTGFLDSRLEMYRKNCASIFSITAHVIPEAVLSIEAYHREILQRIHDDVAPFDPDGILNPEWVNARGAIARFERSSIEIRVIDIQECPLADFTVLMVVSRMIERIASNPDALRLADSLSVESLWSVMQETARYGQDALLEGPCYLEIFGLKGKRIRAGDALWEITESLPEMDPPYRRTLDVILREGPLASRMKRVTGNCTRANLMETCRILCECLQQGRQLVP